MKYPNHIILDIKTNTIQPNLSYWAVSYNKLLYSNLSSVEQFLSYKNLMTKQLVKQEFVVFKTFNHSKQANLNIASTLTQPTWNIFNIFFLRKEKIYTKLKYSRCPQYDMVSGGLAALFAGFLGFLICEKFGLELLDSGDFYIAFMYGVFMTFSLRPLMRSFSKDNPVYNVLSLKFLFSFLLKIFVLLISFIKTVLINPYLTLTYNPSRFKSFLLKNEAFSSLWKVLNSFIFFCKSWPKQ